MFNPNKGPNNSDSESGYGYNENGTERTYDDLNSDQIYNTSEASAPDLEKSTQDMTDEEFEKHLADLHKLAKKDPSAAKEYEKHLDDSLEEEA